MQCLLLYLWWYLYSYTKMIFSVYPNGWYVDISWLGGCAPIRGLHKVILSRRPTTTYNQLFIFHIMLAYQSFQFSILQFWPYGISFTVQLVVIHKTCNVFHRKHTIDNPSWVGLIKSSSLKVGLEARAGGILQCEIWYSWLLKAFSLYLQSHIYSIGLQSQKKFTPINLFPDYVGTHDCFFG